MAVDPIPSGYPRVSPYLCCRGAADAIEFYKDVLGATERMRMPGDSPENIGHAELEIGSSIVMLADEFPDHGFLSPQTLGGSPVTVHVYVEDVDAVFARALERGATETRPVEDQFYGDRLGQFTDPWGHRWSVASHVEDVSPEEMGRRAAALDQH
jgi:PhnB protein